MQRVNTERNRECDQDREHSVLHRKVSSHCVGLTYAGQKEERGVVFQQEGVRADKDGDVDGLSLFSVGTVLLVHAQDAMATVVKPTVEPA